MKTIKLTIEGTPEQIQALFGDRLREHLEYAPLLDTPKASALVENPAQYLHKGGSVTGSRGRPSKLTGEGMRKVWDLHKAGYSHAAITRAFKGLVGRDYVRRLVAEISKS